MIAKTSRMLVINRIWLHCFSIVLIENRMEKTKYSMDNFDVTAARARTPFFRLHRPNIIYWYYIVNARTSNRNIFSNCDSNS